jgi:hypothetical protein
MTGMRTAALPLLLALAACRGGAEAPELAYGTPVRVQAPSLVPGWHTASIGTVEACTAVMVGEPPDVPTRLLPIEIADLTAIEARDTVSGGWTPLPVEPLRKAHPRCLP